MTLLARIKRGTAGSAMACVMFLTLAGGPAAAQDNAAPKPAWMEYQNPYSGEQNDLSNPNRSSDEIIVWTRTAATEALTLTPAELAAQLRASRPFFTVLGWGDYGNYLRDSKMLDMIRDQKRDVSTIVDGDISIVARDTLGGRYRWSVTAPLLITFLEADATGAKRAVAGGRFLLRVDIIRVTQQEGRDGMAIDRWTITRRETP